MSSLLAQRAARTAILSRGATKGSTSPVFAKGNDDPTKTLDQLFLVPAGSTMNRVKRRGLVASFSRASSGTNFNGSGNLVTASTNEPRFDHNPLTGASLALLIEEARTNEALWNRDLTKDGGSPWTLSSITAAKDATGLDDSANSASTLTATGANGTCLQTVTKASAANTYSVWVKRKTGTGDIDITDNNGANWTTLTGLSSSSWTRYDITRTQANPAFGIRIVTSGDEVEVDYNQLEAGSNASSVIATTTTSVPRAASLDSMTVTSLLGSANTLFVSGRTGKGAGVIWQIDDGTENERYRIERNASNELRLFVTDGGAEQVGASGLDLGTVADDTDFKLAIRLAANDFASSLDGAAVVTDTSGTLPTVTTSRFGMDTANDEWNSTIKEAKLFNVGKPNAFLQSVAS